MLFYPINKLWSKRVFNDNMNTYMYMFMWCTWLRADFFFKNIKKINIYKQFFDVVSFKSWYTSKGINVVFPYDFNASLLYMIDRLTQRNYIVSLDRPYLFLYDHYYQHSMHILKFYEKWTGFGAWYDWLRSWEPRRRTRPRCSPCRASSPRCCASRPRPSA